MCDKMDSGARSVKSSNLEGCFYLFVKPPSMEELASRLHARGTETEEQISKRLGNAKAELEFSNTPGAELIFAALA